MADATYGPKVYRDNSGNRINVVSGGTLNIESGATITNTAGGLVAGTTGAGGAVTQITSSSTGVTVTKSCGQITTVALTTAAAAEERFTVTATGLVAATDCIALGTTYNGNGTAAISVCKVAADAFDIVITNLHASAALNAVVVINYAIIKSVAA